MKKDKQDRRSQRTRRMVAEAMMELMAEKRHEAITVQDILDRAGIGRSTFYSHYYDIGDVQASLIDQLLESFNQQLIQREPGRGILPSLELFQHASEQRQSFQAFTWGQTGDRLWEMLQIALEKMIKQSFANNKMKTPPVPVDVLAPFLTGAFLNLLKWWLEAGLPYSPEEMDDYFKRLAMPGMWET